MGVLFLFLSVVFSMAKIIAMKKCGAAASGPRNSLKINVIRSCGCVIISLAVCVVAGFDGMNGVGILTSLLSGAFTAFFLFSWVLATQKASLAIVQVVCMLFGVIAPMLIVPAICGTSFATLLQWCGALLLLPASLCFSKKAKSDKRTGFGALPILLLMGVSNGGCVTTRKLYMELGEGSAADFNLITYAVAAAFLCSFLLISTLRAKRNAATDTAPAEKFSGGRLYVLIGVAMVTLYVADYFNALASGSLPVQLLVPLSYIFSMPMTLASDVILFKERFTLSSAVGILLVIASAILTSI